MIGWFARHFGTVAMKDVATYCHREASTLSRQIGQIDADVRGNDGLTTQHLPLARQSSTLLMRERWSFLTAVVRGRRVRRSVRE